MGSLVDVQSSFGCDMIVIEVVGQHKRREESSTPVRQLEKKKNIYPTVTRRAIVSRWPMVAVDPGRLLVQLEKTNVLPHIGLIS